MEEVLDISKDNLEALKEEAALVKPGDTHQVHQGIFRAVQPGKVCIAKAYYGRDSHNKAVQAADGKEL